MIAMVGALVTSLAVCILLVVFWKCLVIRYHHAMMVSAWHGIFETGPSQDQDPYIRRFDRHKRALVDLGYLEHRRIGLRHVEVSSEARKRLFFSLGLRTRIDDSYFEIGEDEVELWATPKKMRELAQIIAVYDAVPPSPAVGPDGEAALETLTAREILDRMAMVYADCRSYLDFGVVKTVLTMADGSQTVFEKPFQTAFVRPDRFRFEYGDSLIGMADDWYRYIICAEGDNVRTWWDIKPGIKDNLSLELAIAGATGISGGSAQVVPVLLLPDKIGGRSLTDMTDLKRIDDARLGENDCCRIQGTLADTPRILWIDKATSLVRRIDKQSESEDHNVETTTTYEAAVDSEIAAELLEFNPPKRREKRSHP